MAPLAVRFTLPPGHIPGIAGVTLTVGVGVTFTVMLSLLLQPLPSVPVTVYCVVAVGATLIPGVVAAVLHT